jgi:hypothetical protein
MNGAAMAYRSRAAAGWHDIALKPLSSEQSRIARATRPVALLEAKMLTSFTRLLHGSKTLPTEEGQTLAQAARRVLNINPFPANINRGLSTALSRCFNDLKNGKSSATVLLRLHLDVIEGLRGNKPWLRAVGEPSLVDFSPGTGLPTYRFQNLSRLLNQTRWKAP